MSRYEFKADPTPRHRKVARPLLAVGAFSLVTGLVLSAFVAIGGPTAPAEASIQHPFAGSKSAAYATEGDDPIEDPPAAEGDVPESDVPESNVPESGYQDPAPEAEETESAPADELVVTNDEPIPSPSPSSNRSYVDSTYYPQLTPHVVIKKSTTATSTSIGESYSYTLTVTNSGTADATGVVVSDALPSDLELDGTPTYPAGWNYALTSPGGVQTVTFTRVGVLAANITPQIFTIPVKVAVESNSSTIENTAKVCAYNTTPACTTDTWYTPVSSLDVFLSAYCQQGAPYLSYEITPHNIDLVAHPLLTLQWAPSVGAVEPWATRTFPSAPSITGTILWPGATVDLAGNATGWPGWTLSGGVWSFNPAGLGANLINAPRIIALLGISATTTAEYPDLNEGGCSGPPGVSQVNIVKSASVTAAEAGESYSYSLSVTHSGAALTNGVVVSDTLPEDLILDGFPTYPAEWSYSLTEVNGVQTLTFTIASLAANSGTHVFTIPVIVSDTPSGSEIVNSASVCTEELTPVCISDTKIVPVKSIDLVVQTICIGDVPYLHYNIAIHNVDLTTFTQVAYEWSPITGPAEASGFLPAAPIMSGNVLWPGAEVDTFGNATDWPGWSHGPGGWYFDPTAPGATLREDSHVTVSINPTTTVVASYPPASAACANPPLSINPVVVIGGGGGGGTPTQQAATNTTALPSTGVEAIGASAIALGSLAFGCGLILLHLSRRNRRLGR